MDQSEPTSHIWKAPRGFGTLSREFSQEEGEDGVFDGYHTRSRGITKEEKKKYIQAIYTGYTNLGLDNSQNHAQPHPITVKYRFFYIYIKYYITTALRHKRH